MDTRRHEELAIHLTGFSKRGILQMIISRVNVSDERSSEMMAEFTLRYPTDIAQAVCLTNEEFEARVRLMAALKMFELGKLSSGKAAELAGLSRFEFLETCGRYRVSVFNYPLYIPPTVHHELFGSPRTSLHSRGLDRGLCRRRQSHHDRVP